MSVRVEGKQRRVCQGGIREEEGQCVWEGGGVRKRETSDLLTHWGRKGDEERKTVIQIY